MWYCSSCNSQVASMGATCRSFVAKIYKYPSSVLQFSSPNLLRRSVQSTALQLQPLQPALSVMHLAFALLFAVLTLVTAVPTPAIVPRGECSTVGPYLLQQLNSSSPLTYYGNSVTASSTSAGAGGSAFTITQDNVNSKYFPSHIVVSL